MPHGYRPPEIQTEEQIMNNCLCNLFNDNWVWLIILAIILFSCCNTGCGTAYNNGGCGCGATTYGGGCGCH